MHTYIYTYIHTYMRTYIHTYIHTFTHTYIHKLHVYCTYLNKLAYIYHSSTKKCTQVHYMETGLYTRWPPIRFGQSCGHLQHCKIKWADVLKSTKSYHKSIRTFPLSMFCYPYRYLLPFNMNTTEFGVKLIPNLTFYNSLGESILWSKFWSGPTVVIWSRDHCRIEINMPQVLPILTALKRPWIKTDVPKQLTVAHVRRIVTEIKQNEAASFAWMQQSCGWVKSYKAEWEDWRQNASRRTALVL